MPPDGIWRIEAVAMPLVVNGRAEGAEMPRGGDGERGDGDGEVHPSTGGGTGESP